MADKIKSNESKIGKKWKKKGREEKKGETSIIENGDKCTI